MLVNGTVIQAVFFLALLLLASVIDVRTRIIPDRLNVLIALTALLKFQPGNLFGMLAALPFLCAAMTCGGMGGGDIKLMAACGLVLGFRYGLLAQVVGLSAMLVFYVGYYVIQRSRGGRIETSLPLAPFLMVGCVFSYAIKCL